MREIKYSQAISEALVQLLQSDSRAFILGVGVGEPSGIFGTTQAAFQAFGPKRVMDTPMSENSLTGFGIGAALCGMKPVLVHARNDFLLLTMDQIVNNAAKWSYMAGGKLKVPFLIRAIIGRGWGQAAQHSQSLQALFAHIPGLQVVMPATPYDAKGIILASLETERTTLCLEHRWLYEKIGPVPEKSYTVPLGKAKIVRKGEDLTLVAVSYMVWEALAAAEICAKENLDVEIIDPISIKPLDEELILSSVKKTGRLVVADTGWKSCGVSAEICALAAEKAFSDLKAPVVRIGLPDAPTPCSAVLEEKYYPASPDLIAAIRKLMAKEISSETKTASKIEEREFSGPF